MTWINNPNGAQVLNLAHPYYIQIAPGGEGQTSRWVASWNLPAGQVDELSICPIRTPVETARQKAIEAARVATATTATLLNGEGLPGPIPARKPGRPRKGTERRSPFSFSLGAVATARLDEKRAQTGLSIPDLLTKVVEEKWTPKGPLPAPQTGRRQTNTVLSPDTQAELTRLAGEAGVSLYLEAWLSQ